MPRSAQWLDSPSWRDDAVQRWVFPPRFDPLPRAEWSSANDAPLPGYPTTIQAMLTVRCWMRDCPAKLGRVALLWLGYELIELQVPRGFKQDRECDKRGIMLWMVTNRAKKQRKQDRPLIGANRHGGARDANMVEALTEWGMPSLTWPFDERTFYLECDHCPLHRTIALDPAKVRAALLATAQRA